MVVQTIDNISFQMKEAYDFSFISKFGRVFKVFDKSSSGCICFGVEKESKRFFLKFAGATTANDVLRYIDDTILRLKYSARKYIDMQHPLLVNLVDAMEIGGGYLTIFDWFSGESWEYPRGEIYRRFITLPLAKKIHVYEGIIAFHAHVVECGYVAIDFNEQSLLYNYDDDSFRICDIDFYAKQYFMNGYSGIWGEPSLMSPEEKRSGAIVDEISNVYTMGALAFVFFAEDEGNIKNRWTLSSSLYDVASKAVSEKRNDRQQSIRSLMTEWNAAKT